MDCACCHAPTKRDEEYVKIHLECWKQLKEALKTLTRSLLELVELQECIGEKK
jgi:hypothetical protein